MLCLKKLYLTIFRPPKAKPRDIVLITRKGIVNLIKCENLIT